MKRLMLGNEAVARGLYEAGCAFVSSYPGTPSTEITEAAAKYPEIYAEWAPNEKVAMEAAFGASLAGKRSFCGMKHVGLNVAADPLFTIAYTGVNAGMIIGVADDAGMHSSQNAQDSRHYAMAAKLPMLEPSDSAEALEFTKLAYELSEEFDTAVLLKMCTRVSHSQSVVDTGERADIPQKPYEKNGAKYIMMPGNAKAPPPGGGGAHPPPGGVGGDRPGEPGGGGQRPQAGHHHLLHLLPVREGGLRGHLSGTEAGHDLAPAGEADPGLRRLGGRLDGGGGAGRLH